MYLVLWNKEIFINIEMAARLKPILYLAVLSVLLIAMTSALESKRQSKEPRQQQDDDKSKSVEAAEKRSANEQNDEDDDDDFRSRPWRKATSAPVRRRQKTTIE